MTQSSRQIKQNNPTHKTHTSWPGGLNLTHPYLQSFANPPIISIPNLSQLSHPNSQSTLSQPPSKHPTLVDSLSIKVVSMSAQTDGLQQVDQEACDINVMVDKG